MLNTKQNKILKAAGGFVCGCALAATCLVAPIGGSSAWAVDNTGSTDVTLRMANESDGSATGQGQLAFEVPTVIGFAADIDGNLTAPSADAVQIKNLSQVPIHVTKVTTKAVSPFNIVPSVTGVSDENAIQWKMGVGSTETTAAAALTGTNTASSKDYNMSYKGSSTDTLSVNVTEGKIARVTQDLTQTPSVAQITWTLAAGIAQKLTNEEI